MAEAGNLSDVLFFHDTLTVVVCAVAKHSETVGRFHHEVEKTVRNKRLQLRKKQNTIGTLFRQEFGSYKVAKRTTELLRNCLVRFES